MPPLNMDRVRPDVCTITIVWCLDFISSKREIDDYDACPADGELEPARYEELEAAI